MPDSPGNPIRELLALRERLNRLFEESMGRLPTAEDQAGLGAFVPPVDIFEDGGRMVLWVELPGVAREDVEVGVQEGSLVIHGERRMDPNLQPDDFHRVERSYGPFRRTFKMPPGIQMDAIQAEMRNGVLEVVLPRKAEAVERKVRLEVK